MYISDPYFKNSIQSNNIQQNISNKNNLQNELGCFEDFLKSQLSISKSNINNILANKVLLSNDVGFLDNLNSNIQLVSSLNYLLSSILKNSLLERGCYTSASASASTSVLTPILNSYNNKAKIYSKNQLTYANAPSCEYNRIFNDDIFFGDSITKGLSAYNLLDDSKVYAKVGIGTDKVKEMVDSATNPNPKRVFIMSGINDIGSYNKAQFAQHYTDLVETVKAKYPNARIYIQSILPVLGQATQNNPSLNNGRINEFNSVILQVSKNENVGFLNTTELVSSNENLYANDGIHYKPLFYSTWLNFLTNNSK